jgi:hypothetical protein
MGEGYKALIFERKISGGLDKVGKKRGKVSIKSMENNAQIFSFSREMECMG